VTRLETVCRHNFDPGTHLQLEKMQRPLYHQERPIIERRQRRLDGVVADQHITGQQEILWKGCGCWCGVMSCLKGNAAG
jgi:hypothetical protein